MRNVYSTTKVMFCIAWSVFCLISCEKNVYQEWKFYSNVTDHIFPVTFYPVADSIRQNKARVNINGYFKNPAKLEIIRLSCQEAGDLKGYFPDSVSYIIDLQAGYQKRRLAFDDWIGFGYTYAFIKSKRHSKDDVNVSIYFE